MSDQPRPVGVEVHFSCRACGIRKRRVMVPARQVQDDLAAWMATVGYHVGWTHQLLSPLCPEQAVDVVLPAQGPGRPIGAAP